MTRLAAYNKCAAITSQTILAKVSPAVV